MIYTAIIKRISPKNMQSGFWGYRGNGGLYPISSKSSIFPLVGNGDLKKPKVCFSEKW
jgi:hypothetical protein